MRSAFLFSPPENNSELMRNFSCISLSSMVPIKGLTHSSWLLSEMEGVGDFLKILSSILLFAPVWRTDLREISLWPTDTWHWQSSYRLISGTSSLVGTALIPCCVTASSPAQSSCALSLTIWAAFLAGLHISFLSLNTLPRGPTSQERSSLTVGTLCGDLYVVDLGSLSGGSASLQCWWMRSGIDVFRVSSVLLCAFRISTLGSSLCDCSWSRKWYHGLPLWQNSDRMTWRFVSEWLEGKAGERRGFPL